jgi:hypothetical protein
MQRGRFWPWRSSGTELFSCLRLYDDKRPTEYEYSGYSSVYLVDPCILSRVAKGDESDSSWGQSD